MNRSEWDAYAAHLRAHHSKANRERARIEHGIVEPATPNITRAEVEELRAEPCSSCGRTSTRAIVSCRTRGDDELWDTWCGNCVRDADDPAAERERREQWFARKVANRTVDDTYERFVDEMDFNEKRLGPEAEHDADARLHGLRRESSTEALLRQLEEGMRATLPDANTENAADDYEMAGAITNPRAAGLIDGDE